MGGPVRTQNRAGWARIAPWWVALAAIAYGAQTAAATGIGDVVGAVQDGATSSVDTNLNVVDNEVDAVQSSSPLAQPSPSPDPVDAGVGDDLGDVIDEVDAMDDNSANVDDGAVEDLEDGLSDAVDDGAEPSQSASPSQSSSSSGTSSSSSSDSGSNALRCALCTKDVRPNTSSLAGLVRNAAGDAGSAADKANAAAQQLGGEAGGPHAKDLSQEGKKSPPRAVPGFSPLFAVVGLAALALILRRKA